MWRGYEILNDLQKLSGENTEVYGYKNCKIRNSSLRHGQELYKIGIQKFLGNSLISRLSDRQYTCIEEIRAALQPDHAIGLGDWVDLSGLITPKSEVARLLNDIEQNHLTIDDVHDRFVEMHTQYYSYEWTWALARLQEVWGCSVDEVSIEQLKDTISRWLKAVVSLDKKVYDDARKEFDLNSHTGFGVDGDRQQVEADFEEVRGSFDSNAFVQAVLEHIKIKTQLGESVLEMLQRVS